MTVGMSPPPIGMISRRRTAATEPRRRGKTQGGAGAAISQTPSTTAKANSSEVDEVLALVGHGPRGHKLLQLAERHDAGRERQVTEQDFDDQRHHGEARGQTASSPR